MAALGIGLIGLTVGVVIVAAVPFAFSYRRDCPACPKLSAHAGLVTFVYLAVVTGQELFRNAMWVVVLLAASVVAIAIIRRVIN